MDGGMLLSSNLSRGEFERTHTQRHLHAAMLKGI